MNVDAQKVAAADKLLKQGEAALAAGRKKEAAESFRDAIAANPIDRRQFGPYARLLEILGEREPKPDEYFKVLEQRLAWRRNDAKARAELAERYEQQGEAKKAVALYQQAVGIRPSWLKVHRALAPLAAELGQFEQAYDSWRMVLRKRPRDRQTLTQLVRCAQQLGLAEEVAKYQQRLDKLAK